MKNAGKLGIVALFLIGIVATSAFAFGGFGNEAARQALKDGDYEGWKSAMTEGLTEERFDKMKEKLQEREQHREEMNDAIEEGYDAWKEFVSESPRGEHLTEVITEENFDTFVEMHNARQEGDHEQAKELASELGLPGPKGMKGHGMGRFGKGCNLAE